MAIHINRSGTATAVTFPASQEVVVSHLDDSIKVGDGTDLLAIRPDGSIDVNVAGGSVTVGGNIGTVETGTVETAYAEVLAIGAGVETLVVSYTAVQPTRLKIAEVSGTNIAAFTIYVNGAAIHKKRTYFGMLDNNFTFSKGYAVVASDVISVKVLHGQASAGDFNAFLLVLKD